MLDELRCIYCGMCEEACPVDAIELTHIYDMTSETREAMVFNKEKLLAIYDQDEGQPDGPGAHARGRLGPASEFEDLATLGPATPVERDDRAAKAATPGVIGAPPPESESHDGERRCSERVCSTTADPALGMPIERRVGYILGTTKQSRSSKLQDRRRGMAAD